MLGTAIAQLRFAASILFGIPFAPWSLERLVDALLETRREFGAVGAEGAELVGGPTLDEETRRDVQLRRFRAQAVRAARETAYYGPLFERLGLDPVRLTTADIARVPVTPKAALRDTPDLFVRRGGAPAFRTTTTGTTGWPTSVAFSDREMRMYTLLNAIAFLVHGQVGPEDIVQVSTSARATLGNLCFALACQRIGAMWTMAGLVEPALGLALLAEERRVAGKKPRTSFLNVYPSYLGELVEHGLALGYRPDDFGLERISVGGEVVTQGLKRRCQTLFGPVEFIEGYGITEIWPLGGTRCSEGHLHFETSHGLVEVLTLNPNTHGVRTPAPAGVAGSLVATPFPPYREATLVLRYDTSDVVRRVAGPLTCPLAHLEATTDILGKQRLAVRHDGGWTFPREVIEALESVDDVPLPARCGFWAAPGGVAVEVVARSSGADARGRIETALIAHGVPVVALTLVADRTALRRPFPLRCDLRETSFNPPPPRVATTAAETLAGIDDRGA